MTPGMAWVLLFVVNINAAHDIPAVYKFYATERECGRDLEALRRDPWFRGYNMTCEGFARLMVLPDDRRRTPY